MSTFHERRRARAAWPIRRVTLWDEALWDEALTDETLTDETLTDERSRWS